MPTLLPALRSVQERNALIEANLKLAHAYASRLAAARPDVVAALGSADDVAQVALLGLVRAAELFRPELGFRFSTFAWHRMRSAVGRELVRSGFIRVPARPLGDRRELLAALRVCGFQDLADCEGVPYDPPAPEDCSDARQRAAEVARLRQALARLPRRMRSVVEAYHMDGRTLSSIARELGVSRERVRQLRARGEAQLRELLGSDQVGPLPRAVGRRREPAVADDVVAAAS